MLKTGKFILPIILVTLLAALIVNCSTANQDNPLSFVDSSGNHPDGWITAHGAYASPDGTLCMDCHGDDLAGGITGVSCSSDAVGCHSGGPAFHPADWVNKSASGNTWHADAYQDGLMINGLDCVDCHTPPDLDAADGKCVICHFTLSGSRTPGGWTHANNHSDWAGSPEQSVCIACHEVNISFGNQPYCHNCHNNPVAHEVEYLDHNQDVPDSGDFSTQCSSCHAISGTSPNTSAPVCVSCHDNGSPYSRTNCTSCHGRPPSSGEHGEHGSTCSNCHQGAGTGSGLNHFYDGAVDVVFAVSSFTYSSGKCNGSCHGENHNNRSW